jgi:D-alanine-D-alanine ligase
VKVAVLKGGRSLERGVSLRSGARVEDALERLGHEVVPIDVGADLVKRLRAEKPDVAFVAMHGVGGEDGTAQELLEILGIPFTGPAAAACARSIDKVMAKATMRVAGIPTPEFFAFTHTAFRDLGAADALTDLEGTLGFPIVVKPSRGGSSLGVKFAGSPEEVPGAEALPIVEAIPAEGDPYDFEARYEIGRTHFVCPADLSPTERGAIVDAALGTCRALGCEGFARVDLILGDDGPWVLEVNAIPGLTDTSLLPQSAEAAGMSFENLVTRILDLALSPSAA